MIASNVVSEEKKIYFPVLMVNKHGQIVMFENSRKGVLVCNGPTLDYTIFIGESSEWDISKFEQFYGTVTLSNKEE